MKIQFNLEKNYTKVWFALIMFSLFAYVSLIDGNSLLGDEAYSMAMINHSYREIWSITATDVHPPLYYYMLKAFLDIFGHSIFLGKLFSVFPYVAITAIGGLQIRRLLGEATAFWFCIIWALYPFPLLYSVELRMYSWAALFVFISCIYAYRSFKENGIVNWIILTISTLAAAYTHYFALVSVGIVYIILIVAILLKQKNAKSIIPLVFSLLFCFIGYVPWLGEFYSQLEVKVTTEYWIQDITIRTIVSWVLNVFGNINHVGALIFAVVALFLFISLSLKKGNILTLALLTLAVPVGTAFIGLVASIAVRPVFIVRYLVPSAPCIAIFLAMGISNLEDKNKMLIVLSILLTLFVTSFYSDLLNIMRNRNANVINSAFVQRYSDASCFIVEAESDLSCVILAYEAQNKCVYGDVTDEQIASSPFQNLYPIDDLDLNTIQNNAILITDDNVFPSDNFTSSFSVKFLEALDSSYDIYEIQRL